MATPYRIFGIELSPYSVKVRSYFRFKRIPHEWVVRHMGNMEEFQKFAKLPLIPLVITPEGAGLQDSTPILEQMERLFPEPSITPPDAALGFLSALIEEYADEWGNKPMFHFRWWYPPDQKSAAERIARANLPGASDEAVGKLAASLEQRMIPRLRFVGSSAETREQIEASFLRQLAILEPHLAQRPYLFGARPCLADFGLFAQLYECSIDPTPGAILKERAPRVAAWIERMLAPEAAGDFEPWSSLAPTLEPLLAKEVAGLFLPWSTANAKALAAGQAEFEVSLEGRPFRQQTQKYHARSLAALADRYAKLAAEERRRLEPVLARTGCLPWLAGA
ncbi:MAG TPA: glutathione S-transferase family protein [Myxococcota bacterium]